ncbi:MAG: hypothetical protein MUF48_09360 [Pirellulaceae bacterium]|nr:hypothetical protein [Pirellulaceae bacterium]
MTNKSTSQVKLVLCDNEGIGRIRVGLDPFFEFSFWMAEELQDLLAQHEHWRRPRPPQRSSGPPMGR